MICSDIESWLVLHELSPGDDGEPEKWSSCTLQNTPNADHHWQQKYNQHLWFHFTPAQLADWYNQHHRVEDILPPEKNGMGLASWRGEHTASVGLREDAWVDFGASARRVNGKQDGGDVLELIVRVTEEAKPKVMREIALQLVSEAREAVESAAQSGEQPPQWVQAFISPAGWQHYRQLREEAGHSNQAITASEVPIGGVAGSCTKSPAQALPAGRNETHDTPEALAVELGAIIGEPCKECGCTLYYQSGPYQMCHWCLPRPAKYGLLSDEQHARLRSLVKCKLDRAASRRNELTQQSVPLREWR